MTIENDNIKNQQHKEDIAFRRGLLDKHSQLMRMYLRDNNIKLAKAQFEIIKPVFNFLNNEGEIMRYYTLEDFERDSKRFEKMSI
ncbi:MAG TPA: hypothetical protein GXX18_06085 [Bacillales bacterium]|nr:hypothetical protein [Bacillales bacterium]